MWENNRLALGVCVVCGVATYLLSIYLFILVIVCIYLFVFHFKSLGRDSLAAAKKISFTVPSWIKNIKTSLMNSYHLSKPLEPEPNPRRDSPYSSNVHLPRRGNCRSGHFTCLDENIDYVNRRNGIGVVTPSPTLKNSFSDNIREIRRRDTENSTKLEDFSTSHVSPWTRNTSYSSSEFSNVRRVQTVAGPLLGSPGLSKRRSHDYGLFVEANSPGLASRVVQYREEGASPSSSVWTHQPQYSSPGQFPMVHLSHSPSTLPVLSPHNSQKASRRSVRVKIAPPDPLGSRLFPLTSKNNSSVSIQTDHSTKSVIETLKEISRKRIHSQLEDTDDDAAKRQKRSGPSDTHSSCNDGDNLSKRTREESPRHQEVSPPSQPAKRIRNNEISSSLSSSRKLLQSGGVKRKTHNLDWSRCSTPVIGKQQRTTSEDLEQVKSELSSRISLVANTHAATLNTPEEITEKQNLKESKTFKEKEKRNLSGSIFNTPASRKSTPETSSNGPVASQKNTKKVLSSPLDDTLWQKDTPFVSVASPDDVIDDVSALEEKREQDRRSRLLSMMTVISGGEPPLKESKKTTKLDTKIAQPGSTFPTVTVPSIPSSVVGNNSEKTNIFGNSTLSVWGSKSNLEGVVEKSFPNPVQGSEITNTTSSIASTSAAGIETSTKPASCVPTFGFSVASSTVGSTDDSSTSSSVITVVPATTMNSQAVASSPLGPLLNVSSQSIAPVFGSSSLFGSKPTLPAEQTASPSSQIQTSAPAITSSTSGNGLFSFVSQQSNPVVFGAVASVSTESPIAAATSVGTAPVSAATSTNPTSLFQIRPAVSEAGKGNPASSMPSIGFSMSVPPSAPASLFSKPAGGSSNKLVLNTQTQNSTPVMFGAPTSSSGQSIAFATPAGANNTTTINVTPTPFGIVSTAASSPATATIAVAATTTSGSQPQPSLFSFGSSATQNSQAGKSLFSSASGAFGQPVVSAVSTSAPNQQADSTSSSKVGGFKFDLSTGGKSLFSSNASTSPSTIMFGSPATTSNEPKPLPFSKPLENSFVTSTSTSNVAVSPQQGQVQSNPFGATAPKATDSSQVKEGIFSFGGNNTVSGFSAPQPTSFSGQHATTSSAASSSFSFKSATSSVFPSQPANMAGFSLPNATTASSNTFSAPTTSSTAPFSFGSSPAFTPAQPSNMFSFGSSPKTQPETQPGNMFSFGSSSNVAPAGGTSLFGQPSAPVQSQPHQPPTQVPTTAFQFGSSSTPQIPGAFNFGASSTNPPINNPAGGSFSINAGGFGGGGATAAPAMFSIGSGSTAPRVRSARSRRTK